jgi:chitodextrinase
MTEVKKKNLSPKAGYQFRVRPVTDNENVEPWSPPSDVVIPKSPVKFSTHKKGAMPAPWCKNAGMKNAILVCWTKVDGALGYELQMKEGNRKKAKWTTVAAYLSGNEVRKKNCMSKNGYQFRVRPVTNWDNPFSDPSFTAIGA